MAGRRLDWQVFGLLALAIMLLLVGLIVAQAVGLTPSKGQSHLPSTIASGARTVSSSR
jgi:hypothetical protein